jgi:hypothetical protein
MTRRLRNARPRSAWAWVRALGGLGILALLAWEVGTGPFLSGVRAVDGLALLVAFGSESSRR